MIQILLVSTGMFLGRERGERGAHITACVFQQGWHVQVGMSTGLTARVAWKYNKRTTVLSSARVSVVGGPSQVEVGVRYRWGRLTSTGLAVAYGTQVQPCPALPCVLCLALRPLPCLPSTLPSAQPCDLCPALPSALPSAQPCDLCPPL